MDGKISWGKILIVDDDESVGRTLGRILKKIDQKHSMVVSAEDARSILEAETFELILCDIHLPGESGMSLTQYIRTEYPDTAVIMISGVDDPEVVEKALRIGVYGYIIKPFKISEVIINVSSALKRQKLEVERRIYRENLEKIVAERTVALQQALDGIIKVVAQTVEIKDPYTAGHQHRVADLAVTMARENGLANDQIEGINLAGMIHDLGKISIPAEILSTPRPLNAIEFQLIKTHPQTGYNILKDIDFPWPIALIILQHHERMNGSGYPNGLKGKEILPEARILAVADVVEAIASHRPYRPALGMDAALEEIEKNKGILYDPEVVDVCLILFKEKGFKLE